MKASGRRVDHSTVRLGSGLVPMFSSVCSQRKLDLVTMVRPSTPMPPIDSVTHCGSPAKIELYSGVRANFTMRSFITRWSTIS